MVYPFTIKYIKTSIFVLINFKNLIWMAVLCCFCLGCTDRDNYDSVSESVDGYEPFYIDKTALLESIKTSPSRALGNTPRILANQTKMFALLKEQGVQVWDITDTTKAPIPLYFLEASYTQTIALSNNFLIIQNNLGLIYLEIAALPRVVIHSFMERPNIDVPPPITDKNGNAFTGKFFFDCLNNKPNLVILHWQPKNLKKPKCFTIQQ